MSKTFTDCGVSWTRSWPLAWPLRKSSEAAITEPFQSKLQREAMLQELDIEQDRLTCSLPAGPERGDLCGSGVAVAAEPRVGACIISAVHFSPGGSYPQLVAYGFCALLAISVPMHAMAVPHGRAPDDRAGVSIWRGQPYDHGYDQSGKLISLHGQMTRLDVEHEIVALRWSLQGCSSSDLETCTEPSFPVHVHFNGSPTPNGTYDPTVGTYRVGSSIRLDTLPTGGRFETTHPIEGSTTLTQNEVFYYPFDMYAFTTYVQAVDPATNETIAIVAVSIMDATNNFVAVEKLDVDTYTRQVDPSTGRHSLARTVQCVFQRSPTVKAFNMGLFLASWSLVLVALYISQRACTVNQVSETLILWPSSLVGIISSLRTLWPDAPSFGILLDMFGLIPHIFLLTISFLAVFWRRTHASLPTK